MILIKTALAQSLENTRVFENVRNNPVAGPLVERIFGVIILPLLTGLFVLTMLVFIWGVVGIIRKADDPTARKEGQNHILWGAIGMLIMVSVYGIIRLVANTLGVPDPFL